MKNILRFSMYFCAAAVFLVAGAQPLVGQYAKARNGVSFGWMGAWDGFDVGSDDMFDFDGYGTGAQITYHHAFNDYLGIDVPFQLGTTDLTRDNGTINSDAGFINTAANLRVQYMGKSTQILVPYVRAGFGAEYSETQDVTTFVPLGLGLDLRLSHHVYLTTGFDYRNRLDADSERMTLHGGLKVIMGDGTQERRMRDRDKDGVADEFDECPELIGLAENNGCPDMDGDGVIDKMDDCPDVAGIEAFMGCPDTDEDGIKDSEDECPTEAGPASNNGCPIPDSDGDGLNDEEDQCPNEAGPRSLMGCPDNDGDGIANKSDKCPDEAGPASNEGCPLPDTDGDGVIDAEDACPELAGPANLKGCPDSDGDGLADINDKCPTEAGPASNEGCPELKVEEVKVIEEATKAIQFETGSSVLKSSSLATLDQIAQILINNPSKKLQISGYTDNVGREDNNQKLSERRAKACFDRLITDGVDASRMSYVGFGEANPIATNDTPEGRAQNRRVVFEVKNY